MSVDGLESALTREATDTGERASTPEGLIENRSLSSILLGSSGKAPRLNFTGYTESSLALGERGPTGSKSRPPRRLLEGMAAPLKMGLVGSVVGMLESAPVGTVT